MMLTLKYSLLAVAYGAILSITSNTAFAHGGAYQGPPNTPPTTPPIYIPPTYIPPPPPAPSPNPGGTTPTAPPSPGATTPGDGGSYAGPSGGGTPGYSGPSGGATPGYSGPMGGGSLGPPHGATPPAGGTMPRPAAAPTARPMPRGTKPAAGRGFGSTTRARPNTKLNDRTEDWDWWWDLNEERFLNLKNRVRNEEASSRNEDEFLGGTLGGSIAKVGAMQIRRDILPALRAALKDPFYDTRAGAVIALGKIGDKSMPEVLLDLRGMLADSNKIVQESACLALGVLGNKKALADLAEIARNSPRGRNLAGREGEEVPVRMRTFASVAIGLIGGREGFDAGEYHLEDLVARASIKAPNHDVQVGAALAIHSPRFKSAAPALLDSFRNEGLDRHVRAHAGVALGKIGTKAAIPDLLKGLDDAETCVANSSAISLGMLSDRSDRETIEMLVRCAKSAPARSTRNFCIIALGEIGGEKGSAFLLDNLRKGETNDRTFSALALGIMGNKYEDMRAESGRVLLDTYATLKGDHEKAAVAIGLALCGHKPAREMLADELAKGHGNQDLKGHLCTALGLLNHADSIPAIQDLARQKGDQELRKRAAIALGLLKDPDAVAVLAKVIEDSAASKAILGAATVALGYIGDRHAVPILVSMLENRQGGSQDMTRAFATVALGILGDKDDIPCISGVQENSNYLAQSDALTELLSIL